MQLSSNAARLSLRSPVIEDTFNNASRCQSYNDSDDTISHFLRNGDGRGREFNRMLNVQTVKGNGVPYSYIREIHRGMDMRLKAATWPKGNFLHVLSRFKVSPDSVARRETSSELLVGELSSRLVDLGCNAYSDVSMADLHPSIAQCAVVAAALKVLLFPA